MGILPFSKILRRTHVNFLHVFILTVNLVDYARMHGVPGICACEKMLNTFIGGVSGGLRDQDPYQQGAMHLRGDGDVGRIPGCQQRFQSG